MRRRFSLLLMKKRGARRTGSPLWARVGDALYHTMFVVAGLIGLWWSLYDVLLPEWRLAAAAEGFEEAMCVVVGERVAERPGLAEPEYCAELEIEFTTTELPPHRVWTRHGVGRDTPSQNDAKTVLRRYEVGDELRCWFNPADHDQVLLSVKRRWWPWLVLSIPLSLVVIGSIGLTRTFVVTQASPERRSAGRATRLGVVEPDAAATRPTLASGLPRLEDPRENPGVERAYRLPVDGAEGWRVAGMATLCVVWNVLVALFAYQIGVGYLSAAVRVGVAATVAIPLAIIGWRMTRSLWRESRGVGGGGVTRIEVDQYPLRVGEPVEATLLQSGQLRIRSLSIWLLCEEIATFRQGTDTRTATAEVVRVPLLTERRLSIDTDEPLQRDLLIEVPRGSIHSFLSPHNEVRWSIEVHVESVNWSDLRRRFPLVVYPQAQSPQPPGQVPGRQELEPA